jgi:hypothetical protein
MVKEYNNTASDKNQVDSVFSGFVLDFNKGGWSVGNGFYNKFGDRNQTGNFKAYLYENDIDLKGNDLEINTGLFLMAGKFYDNGVEVNSDSLLARNRIKFVNNLSYFKKK